MPRDQHELNLLYYRAYVADAMRQRRLGHTSDFSYHRAEARDSLRRAARLRRSTRAADA